MQRGLQFVAVLNWGAGQIYPYVYLDGIVLKPHLGG